jgi:hypothetical protein
MIIIIGAGISGLYIGYILKKLNKDFVIIEKDNRYGGRVYVENFLDKQVPLGAGIGRFEKDVLLYELCKELDVPTKKNITKISYSYLIENNINILEYISRLKEIYNKNKNIRSTCNFLSFLKKHCNNYDKFIKKCGFSDFIHSDIEDTFDDYGFDDLVSGWSSFSLEWNLLLDNLYKVLKNNIILDENIIRVNSNKKIVITDNNEYKYDKLICSATVDISSNIFKNNKAILNILDDLNVQTFSRIYAKVGKGNELLKNEVKNLTILDSFLQKIIPIDSENGIYMIGYNDNYYADKSFKFFTTMNEEKINLLLEEEIENNFKIKIKIVYSKIAYWNNGTTYYKPLKKVYKDRNEWLSIARNPVENIYFIGEGFSKNQGWVEGSLESVRDIINLL